MKKLYSPLIAASSLLFATQADAALLLAGFHDFDGALPDTNFVEAGFVGSWSGYVESATGGSDDSTYGPAIGLTPAPSSVNGTALALDPPGPASPVTVSLTNSSGSAVQLGYLLFDAATSSSNVSLNVSYQITPPPLSSGPVSGNPFAVVDIDNIDSSSSTDYGDYYANLSSLILGIGQTITFTFSNAKTEVAYLDNIAITSFGPLAGVPEPGSLLALGCLVGGGSFLRSRRRKG